MPQRVNMEMGSPRDRFEQALHRFLHAARAQPLASAVHEQRPTLAAHAQVAPQGGRGARADGDDPLLLALPPQLHLIGYEIDVGVIQPGKLGETHASRVEHLQHRQIARLPEPTRACTLLGAFEQLVGFLAIEIHGQRAVDLGRARRPRRIHFDAPRGIQETVECAQCGQRPRHRPLADAALLLGREKTADRQPVHPRPGPGAAVVVPTECGERTDVPLVGLYGVRRVVALLFEELDEFGDLVHDLTP